MRRRATRGVPSATRGVLSFLIVFAAFPALLLIAALGQEISSKNAFAVRNALALERRYYVDLEFKEALGKTLRYAKGINRDEIVFNSAENLAALEKFMEERLREEGVEVDLWAGVVSENEAKELKDKMLLEKRLLKCRACFDLAAYSVNWRGRPVRRATGLLDVAGGRLVVSRNGLGNVPELKSLLEHAFGKIAFGASIYFHKEKIAAVAFVGEGFGG